VHSHQRLPLASLALASLDAASVAAPLASLLNHHAQHTPCLRTCALALFHSPFPAGRLSRRVYRGLSLVAHQDSDPTTVLIEA
jgi:hypothetical protein